MKKAYSKYVAAVAGLLILIIGMLIFAVTTSRKNEAMELPGTNRSDDEAIHFTGEVERMDGEVLESEVHDMGKLVTSQYYYSHAESFENVRTWLGREWDVTKKSFVYTVDGNIQAGVDFGLIQVTVDDDAKTIQISVPASTIVSSEIDHDSFKLVNQKDGWFNDLSVEDVNKTFIHVKEMEEKKAIEKDLLKRADENAAKLLESFIKTLDLKGYSVSFRQAAA